MIHTLYYHRTRTVNGPFAEGWAFGPADADATLGELRDDGPVDYIIPEGFHWAESNDGNTLLYNANGKDCWLTTDRAGRPVLSSAQDRIVLQAAMATLIV